MSGFDLSALDRVFKAIERTHLDIVLVGGQAVSFYGMKYRDRCPALLRFFPLLSKDADWLGTIDDGMRLAAALQLTWKQNPRKGGMQGLSLGRIDLDVPPGARVEILGKILGADAKEIRATAFSDPEGGGTVRVINPLLLYETKGINLANIPQRNPEGGRQDAKQFTVMGIVVAELLRQFALTPGDERALIRSSGRLLEFSLTKEGASLVKAGAMDPFKVLPLDLMQAHAAESVRNLVTKRLPHFRHQLEEALKAVPAEETRELVADLQDMEMGLGPRSGDLDFDQERARELRIRRTPLERSERIQPKDDGPRLER